MYSANMKFLQICIALEAVLFKLHKYTPLAMAKLAPGWALIRVNFDPMQKIEPKVGGGRSFTRLQ